MLSNHSLHRLQAAVEEPDLEGTRYQVIERIGRGGMGSVYLVEDIELQRKVALKVMNLTDPSGDIAKRMWREARIVAQLEHPGIVPIHDVGILPDNRVFYAMKYVQGSRLDEYRSKGPTLAEMLRLFQKICEAVAFANAHGVIHRDLKPENIMVGPFGEVLVMDWGVAKVLRNSDPDPAMHSESLATSQTQHGTVIGTKGYMSPEQARGETDGLDQRTDVYSLGAILSFLLTADHPETDKRLTAMCKKAMSESPSDRYFGAEQLASDIAHFFDHQPISAYRENILERALRFIDRNRFVVYLIVTYLILRFLVLLFMNR
ncbi:serine/threonine protein kinase, partial [bacterium]|nr:serine/threonine protein kinase [bacterium]